MLKFPATVVLVVLASLSSGCGESPSKPTATDYYSSFRQQRQEQMSQRWSGRLYVDLIAEMGGKGMSMTTPSSDGALHSTVIYGVNDPLSGCVDSFVVSVDDDPVIEGYYCR